MEPIPRDFAKLETGLWDASRAKVGEELVRKKRGLFIRKYYVRISASELERKARTRSAYIIYPSADFRVIIFLLLKSELLRIEGNTSNFICNSVSDFEDTERIKR